MVTERSLAVLQAIVEDYIDTREPVGSKAIVERHSFGVSAATIRNDMAALEDEQLITAPHTSSGRIPTDRGYRMFVDRLHEVRPLTQAQRKAIETFLGESDNLETLYGRTVRVLSQLTGQLAMLSFPGQERLLVSGAGNLVRTESDFAGSIVGVMDAIDEQVVLLRLLAETSREREVSVRIGSENQEFGLSNASVVMSEMGGGGAVGQIGVLGPTRMNYSSNIAAVHAVARYLSELMEQ